MHNCSDGRDEKYVSLGSSEKLEKYVDVAEGSVTLEGLYLSPEQAWLAVEDFLDQKGWRSNRICWLHENQVPEGKHWLVSSDCI
ncbi:hypothetical protein [Kiloniella sp. EL199]|uniref:hypothetical protein n=1 Tax=Kiloniella sp. EL199 TaxID=2107581 RepID=UPI000EA373F7|nr:hypothetical protein [Kiloniella sp. EL199]